MKAYLTHKKSKAQNTHGKTIVKKLVGDGRGASTIEINEGNIKSFEKVAKKYNIDFAVKKDKVSIKDKLIFFKNLAKSKNKERQREKSKSREECL